LSLSEDVHSSVHDITDHFKDVRPGDKLTLTDSQTNSKQEKTFVNTKTYPKQLAHLAVGKKKCKNKKF